jgi:hypothetical protein
MIPFFIASLPRSRTAWLANFLSYGPSHCFHEPMSDFPLEDYPILLNSPGTPFAGVADSLNCLVMEQLIDMFPRARVVVVRRDIEEVAKSVQDAFHIKCWQMLERMDRELTRIESAYHPLVIEYRKFDAAKIWKFLFGVHPLNHHRLEMLEGFNVTVPSQVCFNKASQLLQRSGDLLWPFLGAK